MVRRIRASGRPNMAARGRAAQYCAIQLGIAVLVVGCGAKTGLDEPGFGGTGSPPPTGGPPRNSPPAEPSPPEHVTPPRPPDPFPPDVQATADKIDILFSIDNSGSMQDKQRILASAIPDIVGRLTNPLCTDALGRPVANQPDDTRSDCPPGSDREFNPVQDIHIGVIDTSLGSASASGCIGGLGLVDSRARLQTGNVATYRDQGFLAWDPGSVKRPPGERNPDRLAQQMGELVQAVGEDGCSNETVLESWYRFLIDPQPYEHIERRDCEAGSGRSDCATPVGLDTTLLSQRAQFLRPDSLVAILMLSDENDCSLRVGGSSFELVERPTMPRATSACAIDPDDTCCQSCESATIPSCPAPATDAECRRGPLTPLEDPPFLRCWETKRRFGVDYLYPTERYVAGLTKTMVPNRNGDLVPNPLFDDLSGGNAPPRSPTLVFAAAIVGVPWQNLAVDPDDSQDLVYKSARELHDEALWDVIIGRPREHVPALDPFMRESRAERSGINPITGDAPQPSTASSATASPINGHEMHLLTNGGGLLLDLQYACTFELPEPRPCSDFSYCGCSETMRKPICQGPDGSYENTVYRAKAFPGLRQLEVLRDIGDNAIAASICARNLRDPSRSDFGYRPALAALLNRLRAGLR